MFAAGAYDHAAANAILGSRFEIANVGIFWLAILVKFGLLWIE